METEELTTAAVDTLDATLTLADGDVLTDLGTISNTSSPQNTWVREASHLRFSGVNASTSVQLHFRATANESGLTDFHLDDVSFELCSP
ncbi:MAG: hypothetical protein MAG451_02759 [Anaerolineales bacterium]|nr:hypothetical protein [Anaerolineales bacterium]